MAAEGPILTQQAYTTLVNRLMLLLRRAEGNSRISGKLRKRAKVMIVSPSKGCALHVPPLSKKRTGGSFPLTNRLRLSSDNGVQTFPQRA